MIISASRRTDIPAFHGDWFIKRLDDGYVHSINPFDHRQVRKIDLDPGSIDGIVFWTKDPTRFITHLDRIDDLGYDYYFHYTLNDYPNIFEPGMAPLKDRIEVFKALSERIGRSRVIWRYDPIIISERTSIGFHRNNLEVIRGELEGYTDRSMISFLDVYRKVRYRIKRIEDENDIKIIDLHEDQNLPHVKKIAEMIVDVFDDSRIEIFTCSEPFDLGEFGISHGRCIDISLFDKLFDKDLQYQKDGNQREGCLCSKAVDIGAYNTCRFNCSYCYANYSERSIKNNIGSFDIDSSSMVRREDNSG